ncbi:MAG: DUF971 domain-containing protein [Candidatus Eremiobacteraeota bacterium]|nr:DUF971 domain-containing protein [Candidatus Eremiobacteraeota bacterium]MCW5871786.1 DUF971 domain-containing protein [Candidatus Eremiobacteraeota bacterium]
MKTLQPTGLELKPGQLEIRWSDGRTTRHSMAELRRQCPCATCRVERDKLEAPAKGLASLRVIQSNTPAVSEAQILEVIPIGRYALSFRWNDGHATGIYAYDLLLEHQGK